MFKSLFPLHLRPRFAGAFFYPAVGSPTAPPIVDSQTAVTRTLLAADPSWSYGDGRGPEESVWRHAGTFLRVEYVKRRRGEIVERDARLFVSSLQRDALTP